MVKNKQKMKMKNLLITAIAIFLLAKITSAQVPSYVPSNGLVGWWPFNGNANDESGNGNNGTVNGASLSIDRFANTNSSYSFDGVDDKISTSILPSLNDFSFNVFFQIQSTNGSFKRLIDIDNASGSYFDLFISPNNTAGAHFRVNNTQYNYASSTQLSNADWHCITFTRSNDIGYFYIDGTFVENQNVSNTPFFVNALLTFGHTDLGGYPDQFFFGKIDDIGYWNRALTICEIQDLYASQVNSTFVNAGIDQTICNGDLVTLSALNSQNYSWDNGVADGVAFNPTATQDYTVSADSAGCLSTDFVTVTVNEHTSATQTETALDSYTWPINSQTYTSSGMYTAVIPNAAGCDSTITLDLSLDFTGINEFSEDNLFTVFPNPSQSIINVKADSKLIGDVYSIYDNTGRVVLTGKLNSQNTTIELGNLSGGIYMFSVGENMTQTYKVIKE
jgi:hypothetical protein